MAPIEQYLMVPYNLKGYTWDGVNCWGMVCLFWQEERGIFLPRHYVTHPNSIREVFQDISKVCQGVDSPRKFDVVQMRSCPASGADIETGHCGVMVSDTHMLHISSRSGAACQPINDPIVRESIVGFWRVTPEYWQPENSSRLG